METVHPADGGKFFSRQGGAVPEVRERLENGRSPPQSKPLALGPFDQLELSPPTQALLSAVESSYGELLAEYPEFEERLTGGGTPNRSGIHLLASTRKFLNNPHNQQRVQQDERFGEFYGRVDALGVQTQELLTRLQQELRSSQPGTYQPV
jgi:hypothetical protein